MKLNSRLMEKKEKSVDFESYERVQQWNGELIFFWKIFFNFFVFFFPSKNLVKFFGRKNYLSENLGKSGNLGRPLKFQTLFGWNFD